MPKFATPVLAALLTGMLSVPALAQNALPSLGDRISGYVSMEEEHKLGREFLRSLRRTTPTISDPLLNNYLENISYRLASKSELRDHRLAFIIVDSQVLNAFAVPGGVIGVNTGLFLNAETEGEFASVISHELAHVSQRHFARSIEQAETTRIPQMAALLASVVVMATSDAEHGQAALMATQGRALENQLRFSRSNEAEADRVGIKTLFDAGYDPYTMPALFQRLASANRYGTRPPEFLLSHPVTESRIADSRGRAARYPERAYPEHLEYLLMRGRVVTHYAPNKKDAITEYQRQLQAADSEVERDGARYGLAMAYSEDSNYRMANETLSPLLDKDPNRISYVVTQAEILTAQNESGQALNFLDRHLSINPGNHPLTMAYADALIESRRYQQAADLLEEHVKTRPEDYSLWFLIAETQGQAGDISKVHQARAEYFVLIGDFRRAREQLQFALDIETGKPSNGAAVAAVRQKIRDIQALEAELAG
ncbi:MAG: M48 family metalloprotease [Gammaproteobacteria bacterium]|nr:M48 family metallopeptidase [Pseudomonadales bacterium]MCP5345986.1 M48 family metallopeptidase [Pseudomonadales bacterium]